jgi:hypothetical protein
MKHNTEKIKCSKHDWRMKLLLSLLVAFIFLVLSNPMTFRLVDSLFGGSGKIAVEHSRGRSCPTPLGCAIHTCLFLLIIFLLTRPWISKAVICEDIPDEGEMCISYEGKTCKEAKALLEEPDTMTFMKGMKRKLGRR